MLIDLQNVAKLRSDEEYAALIQFGPETDFTWADTLLKNLETFANWDESSDVGLLDKIASLLPVSFVSVPLHARKLRNGAFLDLCLDFGASFSACALAIDPGKSRELACVRNTDKPKGIYYTRFPTGEDEEKRNIVPSALVLREINDEEPAEWLCGYAPSAGQGKIRRKAASLPI